MARGSHPEMVGRRAMSQGAGIPQQIMKVIALVFVFVISLALAPHAMAHGTADTSFRLSGESALRSHPAHAMVSPSNQGVTAYMESAAWKPVEAGGSEPGEPSPRHCDHGCCCGGSAHCASCSGAIIAVEVPSQLFLPKAQRSFSTTRTAAGIPPTPADPPPRAVI